MEGGIADETSMPPFKCECFGSAAYGQPPPWVHTGLPASTMNVKCHTKHKNRRNFYCSSSSHQKSVFADGQIKTQQAQPFITRTDLLTLALYMSHSGGSFSYRCIAVTAIHAVCVFGLECFTNFRGEKRRSLYCSSSSHQKSVFADDKSNTTSPALHHQNQPPDSGSVRESQWQQLWLSLHRGHRHTYYAVCVFVSRVFEILGQDFAKRAHFRPSENLGKTFRQHFYP